MLGIHYSTSGAWGTGIGTLTPEQVDENFWLSVEGLKSFDLALKGAATTINDISLVSGSLDEFIISLSNGHIDGPFALTYMVWIWQGQWLPHTVYETGDVFWFEGAIYQVLVSHTSLPTFSPGANDGLAHDYYKLIINFEDAQLPIGGVTNAALTKLTNNNFDIIWSNDPFIGIPLHGTEGQWLTQVTSPHKEVVWDTNASLTDPSVQVSSGAAIVLTAPNVFYDCNSPHILLVQIVPDTVNSFPIGSEWHFRQAGSAQIEFEPLFPHVTTLSGMTGFQNRTARANAVVTLKKVAAEIYHLFGYLAPS